VRAARHNHSCLLPIPGHCRAVTGETRQNLYCVRSVRRARPGWRAGSCWFASVAPVLLAVVRMSLSDAGVSLGDARHTLAAPGLFGVTVAGTMT